MKKFSPAQTLTKTATAHMTDLEEQRLRKCADLSGLTKSEWCRQVLLEALDASPGTRLVLSEMLALRMIVLRLHTDLLQGIDLTDARLAAILRQAEAEKFNHADRRIQTFHADILKPEQEAS